MTNIANHKDLVYRNPKLLWKLPLHTAIHTLIRMSTTPLSVFLVDTNNRRVKRCLLLRHTAALAMDKRTSTQQASDFLCGVRSALFWADTGICHKTSTKSEVIYNDRNVFWTLLTRKIKPLQSF